LKGDNGMAKQEDIRHIYHQLQGYLSKAPSGDKTGMIRDPNLWNHINQVVDELSILCDEDYNRFKIIPQTSRHFGPFLSKDTLQTQLAGLIARLHGKYFASEPAPFSGMPSTVISQTQVQSQSQTQMVLDLQSKIDEQLRNLEPEDKKHKFLEKVKGALASVKDYAGVLALYVTTAQEFGLTLKELVELFK